MTYAICIIDVKDRFKRVGPVPYTIKVHLKFKDVDVAGEDGEVVTWAFESYPPTMMVRQGWSRDSVSPGDPVTVTGWRARRGDRPVAGGNRMTLPDGRILPIGASSEAENR